MADVIGRGQNVAQMSLIVVLKFLERLFPGALVQLEIGLESGQDAVLFFFYDLVVLVDGEVEGSHQLPVLPGFVNVKLVIKLTVSRQEIDNNSHRTYKNKCLIYQISERELFVFTFEIVHIG